MTHGKTADEIDALRATIFDLLEILRQWEPDHASGEDRRRILLAMYQVGVLRDPTETITAMNQTESASHQLPRCYRCGRLLHSGECVNVATS